MFGKTYKNKYKKIFSYLIDLFFNLKYKKYFICILIQYLLNFY